MQHVLDVMAAGPLDEERVRFSLLWSSTRLTEPGSLYQVSTCPLCYSEAGPGGSNASGPTWFLR
jgi:hypothetical protein